MAIPPKQIGQSTEANLIYNISKQLNNLTFVISNGLSNVLAQSIAYTDSALLNKQDILISGVNIKTVNGESILGAGDIIVSTDSITVVNTYSELPLASTVTGDFFWVENSQGTQWLPGSLGGTYYSKGMYYSNGITYEYTDIPYNATSAEVITGLNNTKFVTPLTLSDWWTNIKTLAQTISGLFTFTNGIKLSPLTNPTYTKGLLFYDNSVESLAYYDDITGTTNNINYEQTVRARNNTGSTILNGQVVYITGAIGQNPTIGLALSNSYNSSVSIGIATHDIPINTLGKITTFGLVNDLNTSAFSDGAPLYLSSSVPGGLTATPTVSPNYTTYVCIVLHSHVTQGKIFVRPEAPISLNTNLTDLNNVSPSVLAVKTFLNTKQDILTNPITGTGTANFIPKWTGTTTQGNSMLSDSGTELTLNQTTNSTGLSIKGFTASTSFFKIYLNIVGDAVINAPKTAIFSAGATNAIYFRPGTGGLYFNDSNTSNLIFGSAGGNSLFNTTTNNGQGVIQVNGNITALPATLSNQVTILSQITSTTNTLPKFGTTGITNSNITDNGTTISTSTDMVINMINIGRGGGNLASNTVIGQLSGQQMTASSVQNTAMGSSSFRYLNAGGNSVAVGNSAGTTDGIGTNLTAISNSIIIGQSASPESNSQTNQIVIAQNGKGLGSNTTVIGNSSTTFGRWWGKLLVGKSVNDGVNDIQANSFISSGDVTLGVSQPTANNQVTRKDYVDTALALKQNVLTNPITGTGVANFIPKFTGTSTQGNSQIIDNGTSVMIGGTTTSLSPAINTKLGISSNASSPQAIVMENLSTGTMADARLIAWSHDSNNISMIAPGGNNTNTYFSLQRSSGNFIISSARPLVLGTITDSDILFGRNNSVISMAIKGITGNLLVNKTSDDGVNKGQFNGTVTFSAGTLANQGVIKSQLDLKANIESPTFTGILEFADNAAAITGGLTIGKLYRTGDLLKIVH